MSDNELQSKIELVQEQIENLFVSGHFTEKEIDSKSAPLRMELAILKNTLSLSKFSKSIYKFGLTFIEFQEASAQFEECMNKALATDKKNILDITVIDAEILTPNHQEA